MRAMRTLGTFRGNESNERNDNNESKEDIELGFTMSLSLFDRKFFFGLLIVSMTVTVALYCCANTHAPLHP